MGRAILQGGPNVGGGAAECSIDERESFPPMGTMWNLFASGAIECHPV